MIYTLWHQCQQMREVEISEGFGITFLEANACGKPVIGTNVGGISDAINDGLNGFLIKPNDPLRAEKKK